MLPIGKYKAIFKTADFAVKYGWVCACPPLGMAGYVPAPHWAWLGMAGCAGMPIACLASFSCPRSWIRTELPTAWGSPYTRSHPPCTGWAGWQ